MRMQEEIQNLYLLLHHDMFLGKMFLGKITMATTTTSGR